MAALRRVRGAFHKTNVLRRPGTCRGGDGQKPAGGGAHRPGDRLQAARHAVQQAGAVGVVLAGQALAFDVPDAAVGQLGL